MKKRTKRGRPRGLPPLDERHYIAIEMLSGIRRGGRTLDDVAKEIGVNRRTLYRWRQRKDFARLLEREIDRKAKALVPRRVRAIKFDYTNVNTAEFLLRVNDMMQPAVRNECRANH